MGIFRWKWVALILLATFGILWTIKATLFSAFLTDRLRLPISMQTVSLWPTQTTIREFEIKNPKGFHWRYALKAESTEIDYQLKQLLGKVTVIDQIVMDNVFLSIEMSDAFDSENNWTILGKRIPKSQKTDRVIIKDLVINQLTVETRGLEFGEDGSQKTIPQLEFKNIDSANGFPTEQLIHQIFGEAGFEGFLHNLFTPIEDIF